VPFYGGKSVSQVASLSLAWLAYLLVQRRRTCTRPGALCGARIAFSRFARQLMLMWVLSNWGVVNAYVQNDDLTAKTLLDEALSLAHTLQDPFAILLAYSSLGDWAVRAGRLSPTRAAIFSSRWCGDGN